MFHLTHSAEGCTQVTWSFMWLHCHHNQESLSYCVVCLRQNFTVAQVGRKSYNVAEDDLNQFFLAPPPNGWDVWTAFFLNWKPQLLATEVSFHLTFSWVQKRRTWRFLRQTRSVYNGTISRKYPTLFQNGCHSLLWPEVSSNFFSMKTKFIILKLIQTALAREV